MSSTLNKDLLSSIVSDIKNYNGRDPLLPWLQGIKKMKGSLPPQILRDKLPRFLQNCAQTFESDARYTNDLRYLRVWLQLLDFVDDPKAVMQRMEANRIGMKKSLFYQAYALCYEKRKKFEAADKMYRLGAQNLAEPMNELSKSYEQFLRRMVHHKNKKIQRNDRMTKKINQNGVKVPVKFDNSTRTNYNVCWPEEQAKGIQLDASSAEMQLNRMNNQSKGFSQIWKEIELETNERINFSGDDTVVARFVDTAIEGKSNAEDARHHGLVEPTINTKEAMLAINSMFREPLEPPLTGRRHKNQLKDQSSNSGFEVFIDEDLDDKVGTAVTARQDAAKHSAVMQNSTCNTAQPSQQPFQIYIDDEEHNDEAEFIDGKEELVHNEGPEYHNFLCPDSEDLPPESSQNHTTKPPDARFREDTVVYRFVGSAIADEPKVENAWHHGLVEPTVNLKEAMDDINSMFGKPIEFVRKSRSKKQEKAPSSQSNAGGFMILPDDTIDCQQGNSKTSSSTNKGRDLFEQTICTKEAMDEINNMFKMPLDF